MATEAVHHSYYESSRLATYPFEPYWPGEKLRILVTGVSPDASACVDVYADWKSHRVNNSCVWRASGWLVSCSVYD